MQTYDIGIARTPKQELTAAQEALQVVRDGISRSSASTSNTFVRSTIDGMVLDVPVKEGNSVIERNNFNEGTTIASVADMTDLIFQGNVDESEVGKVKSGHARRAHHRCHRQRDVGMRSWSTSHRKVSRTRVPSSSRSVRR